MTTLRGRRVLFVFATLELGGSERQALMLARHLKGKHRADVRVWGLCREAGRLSRACEEAGIPWQAVRFAWPESRRGRFLELARFAILLRRERPDILLPFNLVPCVACGLAWRASGARLDVWSQRNDGTGMTGGSLHRLAVRLSPRFISNSEHGKRFLVETYRVEPRRVAVIPNGASLPGPMEDRVSWRRRLDIAADGFVAVMVANIRQPKDHATLIKAWRAVLDGAAEAGASSMTLLLAGRFDAGEEGLKSLAFDLGLGERLKFLGGIEDVAGLLEAADLLVHSSRTEGLPNAVIEGMAAGLPVVATDIPGVREAVGSDGFPFLAPPDDPGALSERILELWRDGTRRRSLGAAMKTRAERVFDPEAACERTAAFLAAGLE